MAHQPLIEDISGYPGPAEEERGSGYLREILRHWRPLLAASLGSGTSLPLFSYSNSIFSPYLIKQFGWSRAQFALVGVTMLISIVVLPVIGRLTDRYGVLRVATVGTILVPLCFVGYSRMSGTFIEYLVIATLVLMVGSMTTGLVYARLIAEHFERAQGLALTLMNGTPALLAIALAPLLNAGIETWGWRASYLAVGLFSFASGVAALSLIPRRVARKGISSNDPGPSSIRQDFAVIVRSTTFWIILGGFFLCLLQIPLQATQMSLMLLDNGLTPATAAKVVSIYAFGTIVGRLGCGLALDRYATRVVTAVSMAIPALGYFLLGAHLGSLAITTFAMFVVGMSVGAESDLISFLVARYFQIRIFNTTLSLVYASTYLASALGAFAISFTLRVSDSYAPFLYFVSAAILAGSALFLLLPRGRDVIKIG